MTERLVEVEASDHLHLTGALIAPIGHADACVVWIHGFGLSYDYGPCLELARRVAGAGTAFLTASVRGNHGAVVGWRRETDRPRTVKIGSWFERFDESSLDIGAWIAFARSAGYKRVVLAGHSFGALKTLRYLAGPGQDDPPSVDGLVLASPSLGFAKLRAEDVALANELVRKGDGEQLLPAGTWPTGFGTTTMSAQTYASWWEAAHLLFGGLVAATTTEVAARWAAKIHCPVLAWYGSRGEPGGEEDLARLTGGMTNAASVELRIIDGLSHHYRESVTAVADHLSQWVVRTDG